MSHLDNRQRWGLAVGGILLTLLLAAVFTFGSLNVPFEPKSWVLYAVSSFITAAFLVFGLILARTTLRLWVERGRDQLGEQNRGNGNVHGYGRRCGGEARDSIS